MKKVLWIAILLSNYLYVTGCSVHKAPKGDSQRQVFGASLEEAIAELPTNEEIAELGDLPDEGKEFFASRRAKLHDALNYADWPVERFTEFRHGMACDEDALGAMNVLLFRETSQSCFGRCRLARLSCTAGCAQRGLTDTGFIICDAGCHAKAAGCRTRCVFRTFGSIGIGISAQF